MLAWRKRGFSFLPEEPVFFCNLFSPKCPDFNQSVFLKWKLLNNRDKDYYPVFCFFVSNNSDQFAEGLSSFMA